MFVEIVVVVRVAPSASCLDRKNSSLAALPYYLQLEGQASIEPLMLFARCARV